MLNKKFKNTYRLALYGLSGSGKTCLLAALAMQRNPHPLSHSCIWNPPEIPKFSKETSQEHLLQKNSKDWMETAINKLANKEFPDPNPKGNEQFVFEYNFTASTHQIFRIELIDYSGELINPPVNVNTLAKNLRRRFAEVDGIVVFAEVSDTDNSDELFKLQQTFSLLLRESNVNVALDTPVALLVTKWDRYSKIDYSNPANEQTKLDIFINSTPSHRRLVDILRFSTTEGNFKIFPVSALGTCEQQNSSVESGSFGLEDAFIWLAQQRNNIDLQQFKEQVNNNSDKCKKKGKILLERFPKNSEQIKQIKTLLQECHRKRMTQAFYGIIIIIGLWFVTETSLDIMNYRQHTIIASLPHTTTKQLDEAENWLVDYIAAPYFRHSLAKIFFNNNEANSHLTRLQINREKLLWEPVTKVQSNLIVAANFAIEYLIRYPQGKHAQQARNIKLNAELLQNRQANADSLRDNQFFAKNNWQDFDKISNILVKLRGFPLYPKVETDKQRQKRILWESELATHLLQLTEQQNWLKFLISYEEKIKSRQFIAVAQALINHHPTEHLEGLKTSFREVVVQELEELVEHTLKDNINLLKTEDLLREYTRFPPQLQTNNGKQTIALLRYKIHERIDEELYNEVIKNLDLAHIQKYLQEAPLRNMRREIMDYKNFLSRIDPSNMLRLRLKLTKITWVNVNDQNNIVSVFLNGKQAIYNDKVDANHGSTTTGIIGLSSVFSAKPNHPITIAISVTNEGLFLNDDYGHAMVELTISELAEPILGYPLTLRTDENKGQRTGTAFFELEGFPREPLLPPWRSN